ncbi:MAG TPA: hypothetical protein GXZ48_02630 [Acholeplasmataceae bacterium]|nr:hypothetical protein [Acholeplasmataceae bacterium]
MRKYGLIFIIFLLILLLNGCKGKHDKIISFSKSSYVLNVDDTLKVNINVDERYKDKTLIYNSDNINIAKFENGIIYGVSSGYVRITVAFEDDPSIYAEALVNVKNKIYNIVYEVDENVRNENPAIYNKDILPIILKEPVKVGYSFQGWYKESDYSGNKITVLDINTEGDITLYPKWDLIESKIIYFLRGGKNNENNPTSYTYESVITLLEPYREGYKFLGWYKNKIEKIEKIGPHMIEYLHLYASWELDEYEITYHLNGGENNENNPNTYTILDDTIHLHPPTKAGHKFIGWYKESDFSDEECLEIEANSFGNLNLYAKWEEIEYPINYHFAGEINNNPSTYTISQSIILNIPIKSGYEFLGWYDNPDFSGAPVSEIKQSIGEINLYGKWEIVVYDIIYDTAGGINNSENPDSYTILDNITFNNPIKDGYTFDGWYLSPDYQGNKITEIPQGSSGLVYLYAKWKIIAYTITYHLNGGTNDPRNPHTFTIETNLNIKNPVKSGYEFLGWYLDEDFNILYKNELIKDNINLYAKWEIIYYTIEYDLNGGYWQYYDKSNLIYNFLIDFYQYINPYESLFEFIHGDDYSGFDGLWYEKYKNRLYSENHLYENNSLPYFLNQSQYYHKWNSFFSFINGLMKEKNINEDISKDHNIGTLRIYQYFTDSYFSEEQLAKLPNYEPKIKTYTVESEDIILPTPKNGYAIFMGWYVNSDFSGAPIDRITRGSTQNYKLYAKWKEA